MPDLCQDIRKITINQNPSENLLSGWCGTEKVFIFIICQVLVSKLPPNLVLFFQMYLGCGAFLVIISHQCRVNRSFVGPRLLTACEEALPSLLTSNAAACSHDTALKDKADCKANGPLILSPHEKNGQPGTRDTLSGLIYENEMNIICWSHCTSVVCFHCCLTHVHYDTWSNSVA